MLCADCSRRIHGAPIGAGESAGDRSSGVIHNTRRFARGDRASRRGGEFTASGLDTGLVVYGNFDLKTVEIK